MPRSVSPATTDMQLTRPVKEDDGGSEILVIINPAAARVAGGGVREAIETELQRRELHHKILDFGAEDQANGEVSAAMDDAIRHGCKRVIIVGGDGSVSWAVTVLARGRSERHRPVVAIVPAGTANVLARELGLPMDPRAALEVALDSHATIELDAIRTPNGLCLTQVGIGPDARMIDETTREAQIKRGRWAYFATFIDRAIGQPTLSFQFTVDGRAHRARAWQVLVANAGAAGSPPFTWGPGIDPTDGALDLCVFAVHGVRDVLVLAWSLLTGNHGRGARARYIKILKEVTIRTSEPALVQGDGEIIGKTPITLSLARSAIRVVVPRSLADIPSLVGSPGDPASRAAVVEASAAAITSDVPTVAHDVDVMVAMHSRSWVLQGMLKHPFTKLKALDAAIFLWANKLSLGSRADRALVLLSNGMHYGEGWAAVAVAMVLQDAHHGMRVTAEALVVLWATMLTVNFPLKRWFRRRRPFIEFVKARVTGPRPKDFSFPSGHTAAAFAGAVLFGTHLPLWSPLFYLLACLVGFSRVYLGVHYPGDVVLGGLVGTFLAILYRSLLHRWLPGVM